jgi:hypothetical protein
MVMRRKSSNRHVIFSWRFRDDDLAAVGSFSYDGYKMDYLTTRSFFRDVLEMEYLVAANSLFKNNLLL